MNEIEKKNLSFERQSRKDRARVYRGSYVSFDKPVRYTKYTAVLGWIILFALALFALISALGGE